MKLIFVMITLVVSLVACSHCDCRNHSGAETTATKPEVTNKAPGENRMASAKAERVKVYKFDGTLQCNQGKVIPLPEMQKQLGKIQVYSSQNKNDGMMRIQVCGAPTGNCNVYEINRRDLEAAQKNGFKEWVAE